MNPIVNVLKRFGLSASEAKVYLETLNHEELSPYQISQLTNIPRTTVYDLLMSLSLKGLVELEQSDGLQKQQTKVHAKNPSILRKILKDKRDATYKLEADIAEILPELKGAFHKEESNANFKFYPGIEGARKVYLDIAKDNIEIPESSWSQLLPLDIFGSKNMNKGIINETKNKKKSGVHSRELISLNDWTRHVLTYQYTQDKDYIKTRQFRYIEAPLFESFLDLVIKGNYIRITCTEGSEIWGAVIKSEALSKTLLSIYNLNWQMATSVTEELIQSWGENNLYKVLLRERKLK